MASKSQHIAIKRVFVGIMINILVATGFFLIVLYSIHSPPNSLSFKEWKIQHAGSSTIWQENGTPVVLNKEEEKGIYVYTSTLNIGKNNYTTLIIRHPNFQAIKVSINGHILGIIGDTKNGNSNIWNGTYMFYIDPRYIKNGIVSLKVEGLVTYIRGFNLPPFLTDHISASAYMERQFLITTLLYAIVIGSSLVISIILFFFAWKSSNTLERHKNTLLAISALMAAILYIDYIPNVYLFVPYILYKKVVVVAAFLALLTLHMGVLLKVFGKEKKPVVGQILSYLLILAAITSFVVGWNMILFKKLYSLLSILVFITLLYDSGLLIHRYITHGSNKTVFLIMIGIISATVFSAVDVIQLILNLIEPLPNILISPYGLVIVYIFVGFTFIFENHLQVITERQTEAKKAEMFQILSMKDKLTWTWTRAYLEKIIPSLVGNICIIMLDIDHFKQFNDTYGHLEGDKALIHIVDAIGKEIRNSDIIIRYGGEEFLIILAGSSQENGIEVAERIREIIAKSPIKLSCGKEVYITASMGVCCHYVENPTKEFIIQMIKKADIALYRAKDKGRNRVEVECMEK